MLRRSGFDRSLHSDLSLLSSAAEAAVRGLADLLDVVGVVGHPSGACQPRQDVIADDPLLRKVGHAICTDREMENSDERGLGRLVWILDSSAPSRRQAYGYVTHTERPDNDLVLVVRTDSGAVFRCKEKDRGTQWDFIGSQ
jgi:hypothetical protein